MDVRLLVVVYLMICVMAVDPSPYRSRSRNKNSSPTYDQKQTGEYNIQLHLKDFEVVALLSDSTFGEGDYDYNYDYSEITLKPSTSKPSTTSKPHQKPESTTVVQTTLPTTQEPQTTTIVPPITTTLKITESSKQTTEKNPEKSTVIPFAESALSAVRLENELENNVTKEEILKQSTVKAEIVVKPVENLTIIDKEHSHEENLPLVVHRKCASGFTRDKNGRCRRVRRPPPNFSFGISRLANLASKLRQGTNDSQTNENTHPTLEE